MPQDKSRGATFRYENDPDLRETFADSIGQCYFDGETLRLELTVSRLDPAPAGSEQPAGSRRPVCRIAITPSGALDLINRCQQLLGALQKAGMLKKKAPAVEPAKPN